MTGWGEVARCPGDVTPALLKVSPVSPTLVRTRKTKRRCRFHTVDLKILK